jgi:3-oxoacyl-[acyl-carrier protein] reductase
MTLLSGRTIAVTGASRGIGAATSLACARQGAKVLMLGRDLVALESRRQSIASEVPGASLFAIELSVSEPDSVRNAFQRIFREHRELHCLVANAGVLEDALIGMVTSDQIERVFSTNAFGVIYCCQYASRLMARTGGGSIVNVASIVGANGNAGQSVYAGSKAAVIGITQSLAKELASANIRVNAVAPGLIDTEMIRSLPEVQFQERKNSIKMGRIGTPEEVADVILFLASDMSRYVTGQVIGVDGGMLI